MQKKRRLKIMKPATIVYVSYTGYTQQYALLLEKESSLPVYSYNEAIPVLQSVFLFLRIFTEYING